MKPFFARNDTRVRRPEIDLKDDAVAEDPIPFLVFEVRVGIGSFSVALSFESPDPIGENNVHSCTSSALFSLSTTLCADVHAFKGGDAFCDRRMGREELRDEASRLMRAERVGYEKMRGRVTRPLHRGLVRGDLRQCRCERVGIARKERT